VRVGNRFSANCDLEGRVVIPGLVDNHNHIVLLGLRPGYHTPLETAASFADIRTIYTNRISAAPTAPWDMTVADSVTLAARK